jgi:acetyl esterase/lipase
MIDLHGGAWTHFGPAVDFAWCEALARRGYVVISPEVRLAPQHPWPACLDDARAVLAFARTNAASLAIDATRVGAIGGSTGGHLATLLGLDPRPESGGADWVVALWPILDVTARYRMVTTARFRGLAAVLAGRARRGPGARPDLQRIVRSLRRIERLRSHARRIVDPLVGAGQRAAALIGTLSISRAALFDALRRGHEGAFEDEAAMERASPLAIVRSGAHGHLPPILVVQGERDPNVTREMTESFASAYRARSGRIDVVSEPWLGHSYGNVPGRDADRLVERIAGFVESVERSRAAA